MKPIKMNFNNIIPLHVHKNYNNISIMYEQDNYVFTTAQERKSKEIVILKILNLLNPKVNEARKEIVLNLII